MGGDGIGNEVWKYGGVEVEEWLWRICNRVWRGEGWPEEWERGGGGAGGKERSRGEC